MTYFLFQKSEKKMSLLAVGNTNKIMDNYSQNQSGYGRKEQYNIQDEKIGSVGPMDTATLLVWLESGLVDGNTLALEVGSMQPKPISQIMAEKPPQGSPPSEWYLWTDSKSPFNSMINKVNKAFIARQGSNEHKKMAAPVLLQEFENFLDGPMPKDQIPMFLPNINKLAQPFVVWVYKTFRDLGSNANDDEILKVLLNADPKMTRKFFLAKIPSDNYAMKFFSMYNEWRLYIPIYLEMTSN